MPKNGRILCLTLVCLFCFFAAGCVGKLLGALGPPRTIILRDTTTSKALDPKSAASIRVNILKDEREKRESIGKVYNNLGEHTKDLQIHDGRSLDRSITFIIADSLVRDGYKVIIGADKDVSVIDYEISGEIREFDLIEKSVTPKPNTSLVPDLDIKGALVPQISPKSFNTSSSASAYIELTIREVATGRVNAATVSINEDKPGSTAQEMATLVVAKIVTDTKLMINKRAGH